MWGKKTTKEKKNEYVMQKPYLLFLTLGRGFSKSRLGGHCFLGSSFFPFPLQPRKAMAAAVEAGRTKFQTRGGASALFSHRGQSGVGPMDRHHSWRRKWPGQKEDYENA